MKTTLNTVAAAAAIIAFAGAPFAVAQQTRNQDRPAQRQNVQDRTQDRTPTDRTLTRTATFDLMLDRSSELTGTAVHTRGGDKIGDVADFVVSRETGLIDSVLINTGAILGMGGKEVAVPFHSLIWNAANDRLETNMTKASLEAMPEFDRDRAGDLPLTNLRQRLAYEHEGMDRPNMPKDRNDMDPTGHDDVDHNNDRDDMKKNPDRRDTTDARNPNRYDTPVGGPYGADRGILLSTIVGHDLNCASQACGEVEDTIVELSTGRVVYLVIDPDENFLGIADTLRLAPFSIARWDVDASEMTIGATRPQLLAAPEFDGDMTPFAVRGRMTEVYRVYGEDLPKMDRRASEFDNADTTDMRNKDSMNRNPDNTTNDRTNPDRRTNDRTRTNPN